MTVTTPHAFRRETLRDALPDSIAMLLRCQTGAIPMGFLDDYVALNWLAWHRGVLSVTPLGKRICQQVAVRQPAIGAQA
jgi:hypothetical protein